MVGADLIDKYFNLDELQSKQFEALGALYKDWNDKINVISRKDIDNLYIKHVLHSLSIAMFTEFQNGADILDLGTGGGFPGVPMAIMFPEVNFTLIDGTKKKLTVVDSVCESLRIENIKTKHVRAEDLKMTFDFVITRAVAPCEKLFYWSKKLISKQQQHALPNGIIALKGGDLRTELKALPKGIFYEEQNISDFFEEDFFEEKQIIYIQT